MEICLKKKKRNKIFQVFFLLISAPLFDEIKTKRKTTNTDGFPLTCERRRRRRRTHTSRENCFPSSCFGLKHSSEREESEECAQCFRQSAAMDQTQHSYSQTHFAFALTVNATSTTELPCLTIQRSISWGDIMGSCALTIFFPFYSHN